MMLLALCTLVAIVPATYVDKQSALVPEDTVARQYVCNNENSYNLAPDICAAS